MKRYGGAFLWKQLRANSRLLFSQKSSIRDVWLDSKYASVKELTLLEPIMESSFEHQLSCNPPSKLIHVEVLWPAWYRFAFFSIDVKMPSSQLSLSLIFPKIVSRLLTAKTLMLLYLYDTAVSPPPNAESSCSESSKTATQVDFPDKLDPQITIPIRKNHK